MSPLMPEKQSRYAIRMGFNSLEAGLAETFIIGNAYASVKPARSSSLLHLKFRVALMMTPRQAQARHA
jgi:hypothetical protein